jgi:exopolysaccharide biosynthesis polyprenyl glycosylphosphotransferase
MKNNASLVFGLFLVIGDFLALLAGFVVAYILRVKLDPRPLLEQIPAATYLKAFLIVLPLWIIVHAFIGLYSQSVYEKRFSELGRLIVGSFIGILVVIGYNFVGNQDLFPARLVPVYGLGLSFGFLFLFRSCARLARHLLFRYDVGIANVLIIGNTKASDHLVQSIRNTDKTGQYVVGVVGKKVGEFPYFASFADAIKDADRSIHGIIQTELYRDQDKNNEILDFAQRNHVAYRFVPGNTDLFVGKIEVQLFAGLPVVSVHQTALIGWGRVVKRCFDALVSGLLIIVASPLLILIALLEKIFDPRGPIFFRQTRLTRFNSEFGVYKFRTLKRKYNGYSPEEGFKIMGKPELAKQFRENGDFLLHDPRLSKLGRFLRRTSLDELPQLFNVFKGDLSLVGPRALIPEELNVYEKKHAILSVKSGMTGLAQVSGRKDISFEERRQLDVYYVQNWSFWLDLVILMKTIKTVLSSAGAK